MYKKREYKVNLSAQKKRFISEKRRGGAYHTQKETWMSWPSKEEACTVRDTEWYSECWWARAVPSRQAYWKALLKMKIAVPEKHEKYAECAKGLIKKATPQKRHVLTSMGVCDSPDTQKVRKACIELFRDLGESMHETKRKKIKSCPQEEKSNVFSSLEKEEQLQDVTPV